MIGEKNKTYIYVSILGVLFTLIISIINIVIFHNAVETIETIILTLASVPISFIFQTLLINWILERRERLKSAQKINMIIGFFYLEVGTDLISLIIDGDNNFSIAREKTNSENLWENLLFDKLLDLLDEFPCNLDISKINLAALQSKLDNADDLIIKLMMTPVFDSNERFIDLLTALLRLRNLLQTRYYDGSLNDDEEQSVANEICVVYYNLLEEWIYYLQYLQKYSPLLFEKAILFSPFSSSPSSNTKEENMQILSLFYNSIDL